MLNNVLPIIKALSDKNRIRIIQMLQHKPLCVCEITSVLGLATSTVSKHLLIMKEAGLINDKRIGRWITYNINSDMNEKIFPVVDAINKAISDDKLIVQDKEKIKNINKETICSGG
jgi:ArsR family transcriptional regulator